MLQGEQLQPEEYNYTVLIGGCGRAGNIKKAFKLYNDMKKRGLEASDATYTSLFNACAESASHTTGLQQALKLEEELRRKNYPLSTITYHALLKTHAVTNHLQACLHIVREMLQNKHMVTQETLHYLLMGCFKDKANGFRMALQVWRQMLQSGILPDTKNYNLLLRTARDCGFGDPALASEVLLNTPCQIRAKRNVTSRSQGGIDIDLLERQLSIQPGPQSEGQQDATRGEKELNNSEDSTLALVPVSPSEPTSPNVLDLFEGRISTIVSLSAVHKPSDRLALIGGAEGVLGNMAAKGVSPDLKTLTLLVDMMESGYSSLQVLLKVAKQHRVKLDVAFFNSAIYRAAKASDADGSKSVLSVMRQRNVGVNVQTFGCLALGCEREKEGLQLLNDMEAAGFRPNVHVFSALIGRAARRLDYVYLKTILKTMAEKKVWPNEAIIRQLEFVAQYPPGYDKYKSRNNYLVHVDGFRGYYQEWLKRMPAQSSDGEQEDSEAAGLETQAGEELSEAQRNQRAAARRFQTRNHNKERNNALALQQHSQSL
ncbi:pentatricopeptide repeat-containing protein 1, mitochondrial isoform X2 [Gouania willdenowi]|nr:pentatricopeptide repeat-containing protein 1, mitochondrial-like isoform X2 [Gouania willdenowi]